MPVRSIVIPPINLSERENATSLQISILTMVNSFDIIFAYRGIMPTERTQHENAVTNDTNDGRPANK